MLSTPLSQHDTWPFRPYTTFANKIIAQWWRCRTTMQNWLMTTSILSMISYTVHKTDYLLSSAMNIFKPNLSHLYIFSHHHESIQRKINKQVEAAARNQAWNPYAFGGGYGRMDAWMCVTWYAKFPNTVNHSGLLQCYPGAVRSLPYMNPHHSHVEGRTFVTART